MPELRHKQVGIFFTFIKQIATEVKGTWGGQLLLNKGDSDRYVKNKMKYELIAPRFCFCRKNRSKYNM